MFWGLLALAIVLLLTLVLFAMFRKMIVLLVNSIIGIFALLGFNLVFGASVQINFWSVLITAVGGVIGFMVVLLAHFLSIAF